jgi:hypothetical protein
MDVSSHPPTVTRLHYQLDGWLEDDLLEAFPCFIVTERLADALSKSMLTGWDLGPVEVSRSAEFDELYPDRELPRFFWLRVRGGSDADFSLTPDQRLEISDSALALLRRFRIEHADLNVAGPSSTNAGDDP